MITLHRIGQDQESFVVNSDLITTIEANPDTVIQLATGTRYVVRERPHEVITLIKDWRADLGRRVFGTARREFEVRR